MLARYIVLKETEKQLLVLRPYHKYMHAVEEIVKRATETNNNGYIWHTTGERVIIMMGAINALISRIIGTLTKYKSCIA